MVVTFHRHLDIDTPCLIQDQHLSVYVALFTDCMNYCVAFSLSVINIKFKCKYIYKYKQVYYLDFFEDSCKSSLEATLFIGCMLASSWRTGTRSSSSKSAMDGNSSLMIKPCSIYYNNKCPVFENTSFLL